MSHNYDKIDSEERYQELKQLKKERSLELDEMDEWYWCKSIHDFREELRGKKTNPMLAGVSAWFDGPPSRKLTIREKLRRMWCDLRGTLE